MVPTPETETLCELAIEFLRMREYRQPRILDLGVGSGVIAVTVAREYPGGSILAVDVSPEALAVARTNAAALGVADRVKLAVSDLFSAVSAEMKFDLILSNPPYIADPEYDGLPPEVKADPRQALLAGPDGLAAIRAIIHQAPEYLAPRGRIMFEIGYRQAERVAALTDKDERYQTLVIRKDLNDIDRVAILGCG
jgi:release factor glutamine methyltransferase